MLLFMTQIFQIILIILIFCFQDLLIIILITYLILLKFNFLFLKFFFNFFIQIIIMFFLKSIANFFKFHCLVIKFNNFIHFIIIIITDFITGYR